VDKTELIITALQQRIGDLVENYELQIAILRAELTQLTQEINQKQIETEQYTEDLMSKISNN
jgi:hypothetical protein